MSREDQDDPPATAAASKLVSPTSGLSFPSPVTTTPPSLTPPPPPQSPPAATAAAIPTLAATFFLDSFHPLSGSTPSVLRPPSRLVTFISFAVTRYAETATSKQMMSYKALTISTGGKRLLKPAPTPASASTALLSA
ncbi:hypothetical protein HZH66_015288 [Vespula vulgaris]|uniref:Uncharacterized protein n=1 Tax=Vespula vulgaris TaxID=7454 RepID=A0A834MPG5_VESVU|nr:hypothetical protein HZH66_015288 [Vespula vulgaris]